MKLFDIMTAPWAITPEKLTEIRAIYQTHLKGEKIDLAAIEAKLGGPLERSEQGYTIENGVAIITIEGVISRKMNLLQKISGGVSTELVQRDFAAAMKDEAVNSIILELDSPGGAVDGIFELAQMIYEARGKKQVATIATGQMASAGYLIGSAAEKVYISGETNMVGSIGVLYTHVDKSEAQAKQGHKTTEVFAGKYKRVSTENAPLSEEGKKDIQGKVDYIYSLFVDYVAKFRAVDTNAVVEDMAEGRVFIGKQAIKAGLVDGVSTIDDLVASMSAGVAGNNQVMSASGVDTEITTKIVNNLEGKSMDEKKFKAEHGLLHDSIVAKAKEGLVTAADVESKVEASAKGERDRILALDGLIKPGREKMIAEFKADGKTTAAEASIQILAFEDQKLAGKSKAIADDAAAVASVVQTDPGAQAASVAKVAADAPLEDRCKAEWDGDSELRAEFGNDYKSYTAYMEADEAGLVRVLGSKK